MLKRLFTSNTRIKLLTTFLTNPDEEYFIRELTRKLDEQINSIRRELDNLKRLGFLKAKVKNRKKFYFVNKDFIFYDELKNIIAKSLSSNSKIADDVAALGEVKLLALSGIFADLPTKTVDMLIVGNIDRDKFATFLSELHTKRPVKFTVLSEDDYNYRRRLHDRFLSDTLNAPETTFPIKKI